MRDPDADSDHDLATLLTGSTDVMNAMAAGKSYTFECYYLHRSSTKNVSSDQETFLGYADGKTMKIRFFRKNRDVEKFNVSLRPAIQAAGDETAAEIPSRQNEEVTDNRVVVAVAYGLEHARNLPPAFLDGKRPVLVACHGSVSP